MRLRAVLIAAACAVASVGLAGTVYAAPPSLQDGRPNGGAVLEKVELVVKCWETPSGRRRCRTVYVNPYTYNNPKRYPVGSTEWWRAMDRNGSGGYRR